MDKYPGAWSVGCITLFALVDVSIECILNARRVMNGDHEAIREVYRQQERTRRMCREQEETKRMERIGRMILAQEESARRRGEKYEDENWKGQL